MYIKYVDHLRHPLHSLICFPFCSQVVPSVKKTERRHLTFEFLSLSELLVSACSLVFSSLDLPEARTTVVPNLLKACHHLLHGAVWSSLFPMHFLETCCHRHLLVTSPWSAGCSVTPRLPSQGFFFLLFSFFFPSRSQLPLSVPK